MNTLQQTRAFSQSRDRPRLILLQLLITRRSGTTEREGARVFKAGGRWLDATWHLKVTGGPRRPQRLRLGVFIWQALLHRVIQPLSPGISALVALAGVAPRVGAGRRSAPWPPAGCGRSARRRSKTVDSCLCSPCFARQRCFTAARRSTGCWCSCAGLLWSSSTEALKMHTKFGRFERGT